MIFLLLTICFYAVLFLCKSKIVVTRCIEFMSGFILEKVINLNKKIVYYKLSNALLKK